MTMIVVPAPVVLTLPYPPSANTYYRSVGRRVLISADGRKYRADVEAIVWDARVKPMTGPLAMRVLLYPPDRRRHDIDNRCKGLLDALQHAGVYADDNQIADLWITRFPPEPPGCVWVEMRGIHHA